MGKRLLDMEAEGRRKRGRPLSVFVWLYLDGCIRIRMYTMSIHLSQCPGTRSTTLARASAGARSLVEWPALRLAAYPAIARARARPRPAGRHSRHGRGTSARRELAPSGNWREEHGGFVHCLHELPLLVQSPLHESKTHPFYGREGTHKHMGARALRQTNK